MGIVRTFIVLLALTLGLAPGAKANAAETPNQENWQKFVNAIIDNFVVGTEPGQGYHRKLSPVEVAELKKRCGEIFQYPELPCLEELLDPHTYVLQIPRNPPNQPAWDSPSPAPRGVIGIALVKKTSAPLPKGVLLEVNPDGPAGKAGVKDGDILVQVDNTSLGDVENPAQETIRLVGAEVGKVVQIKVWRKRISAFINFRIQTIEVGSLPPMPNVSRELFRETVGKTSVDIGLIKVRKFSEGVAKEVLSSLEILKENNGNRPLSGIVLDLRGNPGGLVEEAGWILDIFLPKSRFRGDPGAARFVSQEHRGGVTRLLSAQNRGADPTNEANLLVLINGESASASELTAGTLQIHGRAVVAGASPSFGKGTGQSVVGPITSSLVPGKWTVGVTNFQYMVGQEGCYRPIQNIGVEPDILLQPEMDEPENREARLARTIKTNRVPNQLCRYRNATKESFDSATRSQYTDTHREGYSKMRAEGLRMLQVLGLEAVK